MKVFIFLSLCSILIAACGTSAPVAITGTETPVSSTASSVELPTLAPSATPYDPVSPSPTPSSTPVDSATAPTPTAMPAQDCIDKAAFSADVTIPDGMVLKMGELFTKTWRIRNEGTCTWTGYELVYAGGDALNGAMSNPMQGIKPGEYGNISVELKAPQRAGGLIGYWLIKDPCRQDLWRGSRRRRSTVGADHRGLPTALWCNTGRRRHYTSDDRL